MSPRAKAGVLVRRAQTRLRCERGITLVLTLGVMIALSAAVVVVIEYGSASGREARLFKTDKQAFALAEAGVNNAIAVVNNPSNYALDPNLLPQRTTEYEGGRVVWSGTLDRGNGVWTLTATGYSRNPTGPNGTSEIKRTLSAKVRVTATMTQPLVNPAWNYLFNRSTAQSPCDITISNDVTGSSRLYVAGDFCLLNNAVFNSPELIVHGNATLSNDARVGAPTSMDTRVQTSVGGSCSYAKYSFGAQANPCAGDQDVRNIFSKMNPSSWTAGVSSSPPIMNAPVADFAGWYQRAIPGPSQTCTTVSGIPPVFDNNYPNRDNSVSAVFELTATSSYTCRVGPPESPSGELSWNATTKTLTVAGTVYIDGSLKVTNGAVNQYNGLGAIYLTGTFLMNNNSKLCGGISGGDCSFAAWDPNSEMLTIVTQGTGGQAGDANGIYMDNNVSFQGALFAEGDITLTNNARSDGPMNGDELRFSNNVHNDSFPTITVVPAGMPGNPLLRANAGPPEMFSG